MNILINFLPELKRKEIRNLRLIGVTMRIGVMAICALCVLGAFLVAINYTIDVEKDVMDQEIASFENSEMYKKTREAKESLRKYSKSAKVIRSGKKENELSQMKLLLKINEMIPQGIILKKFRIDPKEIVIGGVALKRDSLLALEKGLKEEEVFKEVESPISNFVSDINANFEFTIKLK